MINIYSIIKNTITILIIIITCLFINCDEFFKTLSCVYPVSFTLYNENNLLCCKDGIYTYNSNFEEKLSFYKFEKEISSLDEANIITISQYPNNENVILITKYKFYFITPEGIVLFFKDFILNNTGYYYTLNLYKYEKNFNFVIGFINNLNKINLLYYNINVSSEELNLIINYEPDIINIEGEIKNYFYYGITCQIMNRNNIDILTCFFMENSPGEIGAFSLYINSSIEIIQDSFRHVGIIGSKRYIKSVVSPDKSKALICFSDDQNNGYYLKYDINLLEFYSGPTSYMKICEAKPCHIKAYYFSRSEEYIFFCTDKLNFKMAKFDKNMNIIQNENLNSNTQYDLSLSDSHYGSNIGNIIFLEENQNYAFLIDTNYQGTTTTRLYNFPDYFIPNYNLSISTLNSIIISSFPSLSSHSSLSSFISKDFSSSTYLNTNKNNNQNNAFCSFEYFYKNMITNECKQLCSYNEFINEICYINKLEEKNIMNITQDFRDLINKLKVNENTNLIINGNNAVYQIISSEVMDENINKNISIIDFGECEEKLKNVLGIDYILILKMDIFLSNSTNIVMKYEVYNPNTLEKIDISICNDMTINTYLPYSIPDEDYELYIKLQEFGYDLYNPNDSFYQDFCTPYTTDNKTDVLLSDRRLDYYKNISFCEEGCTYKSYNYTNKRVQCECGLKNEITNNIDDIKFYGNLHIYLIFLKLKIFQILK